MSSSPAISRFYMICAMAALVWLFAARVLGPSDLWDQTQPKTVSYTTDIVLHGGTHWILPIERGEAPATKPPLYNWLAAPFVYALGFRSEIAHKMPSVIALCACWLLVVRLGNYWSTLPTSSGVASSHLDVLTFGRFDVPLGWLAGLILLSSYPMFKLGYLARPDMLLTLWLLLAWLIATKVFIEAGARGADDDARRPSATWAALFWLCIALAALTKGPPAIVAVLYAIIAARVLGGSWKSFAALRPLPGLLAVLAVCGAWIYGVWRIDAGHLMQVLWHDEIYGRFTGTGPEGNQEGLWGWFRTLPSMTLYFLVRFFPWSIAAILAMLVLPSRKAERSRQEMWLVGAAIFVILIVVVFTLSTGKRADYIAAAFPPAALLAAWWLLAAPPRLGLRAPWLVALIAAIAMTAMTFVNQAQTVAPNPNYSAEIDRFIDGVAEHLAREPLPVVFAWTGRSHLQAMLGFSVRDGERPLLDMLDSGESFWLIAGQPDEEATVEQWLEEHEIPLDRFTLILQSASIRWDEFYNERMTLYRVETPKR
jgi:4-amino-4-deoxy-L-arabinose transferase-like glycosyltransferase